MFVIVIPNNRLRQLLICSVHWMRSSNRLLYQGQVTVEEQLSVDSSEKSGQTVTFFAMGSAMGSSLLSTVTWPGIEPAPIDNAEQL